MSRASVFYSRLRGLFARKRLERELDDELRFHLDMQIEDNLNAGMSPAEARYAALRSFGGIAPAAERYREVSTFTILETLAQDVRYAARTLRRSPGFAGTSIAVLALAIGANTAMFSVLRAVLLRPLPFRSPEQLAVLWTEIPSQNVREGRSAYRDVQQWRAQGNSFEDMAILDPVSVTLTGGAQAQQTGAARVSPNLFPLLGIQPLAGRAFTEREAEQRERLVLISERLWRSRFASSPGTTGETIEIDGTPRRIIGVIPARYQLGFLDADVWEPHTMFPDWDARRTAREGSWLVIGRLRREVSVDRAQAELNAIAGRLGAQAPAAERNRGVSIVPLSLQLTTPRARMALWMMAGAVLCVLLIAASNVACLSFARSAGREREIAIRAAIGASRLRIVRQLLAESMTLGAISGLAALAVALGGIRLTLALRPGGLARLDEVSLDGQAFGWAMAICLATGLLVGLAPALPMARRGLRTFGREGGRSIAGGRTARRVRSALVVSQFALAILLLTGAGLLARSLWTLERVHPGFDAQRVLSAQLSAPPFQSAAHRAEFHHRVLEEIEALPGVESAGLIGDLFIGGNPERPLTVEGGSGTLIERVRFRSDEVSSGVFRSLAVPLVRGRPFSDQDGPEAPRVAIVNEAMARRVWPGRDPLGARFRIGTNSAAPWFTVVGVVRDLRRQGLEHEPIPQMFEPMAQNPSRLVTLLVRSTGNDPLALAGALRAAVQRVDKHAPVYGVATLEEKLESSLSQRRFQTGLLLAFAVIALLMASIGVYGLIQYSVAARTHEIGIRVAVGARAAEIFGMVMGEGLRLSVAGLVIGLAGALWLGQAASSLLFGITPRDPWTLAAVSLLLLLVAGAACYLPARRAMKVDPMVALRQD